MVLYKSAECDKEKQAEYGCKNFHENPMLRTFYCLCVLYLALSALQLRWGFPILKKPSSVLQSQNDLMKALADIYMAVPFACE